MTETKNKTIELKPCPFCGGEAEVDYYYDDYFSFRIYCKECGIEAFSDVSRDEVIKKWNKRV